MREVRTLAIMALFALILTIFSVNCFHLPKHYEVRKDLSIYFSNADAVIQAVRNSLRKHDKRIEITYHSHSNNMEDIYALVKDVMSFALDETENPTEGDYIYQQYGGYELNYQYQKIDGIYQYTIEIIPHYYTTLKQEQQVNETLQSVFEELQFTSKTTEFEKVQAIHQYVCDTVQYDTVHQKNQYYHLKTTAFAGLVYHRAVCQGYAVLMYRMLRESGIDARVITGIAKKEDGSEELHSWNLVKIGDFWYHIDATWDDQQQTDAYFLKCDSSLSDHIRDEEFATDDFYQKYPMASTDYFAN